MAISDELTRIQTAKADIKASIEAKGVTVSDSTLISGYAALVDEIQTGGGGGQAEQDLIDLIERDVTTFNIPDGTTKIGNSAFYNYSGLTSVTIPNSVTSIGNNAFSSCKGLKSIDIPNSVTSIGTSAFYNCRGLTSVTIGNGITSIGNEAFSYCSGLTSVTIPNSVTSIGASAFSYSGLTSIDIPNSVTSIENYAFYYCSGLTSIDIPNSVTSIGDSAFSYCRGLTSITIQATTPPTLAHVNAFNNTNNCPIYVPAESVDAYKTATNWSSLASRIQSTPTE